MKIFAPLFLGIVICAFAGLTGAAPLQWAGNGHYYEAVYGSFLTWDQAKANAEAAGGYLATITSAGENSFVFNLIDSSEFWYYSTNNHGPYLGGYKHSSGYWNWVNGEAWVYTNWGSGQPDNSGGIEFYLAFFGWGNNITDKWNDMFSSTNNTYTKAYVIEYNSFPVPEPPTMLLLGSGLLGLVRLRRKVKT